MKYTVVKRTRLVFTPIHPDEENPRYTLAITTLGDTDEEESAKTRERQSDCDCYDNNNLRFKGKQKMRFT